MPSQPQFGSEATRTASARPGSDPPPLTEADARALPTWFPPWVHRLADLYFSRTTCVFILHGNVHDLLWYPEAAGDRYVGLAEFLGRQVFGRWDLVLAHDLSRGLHPLAGGDPQRLRAMMQTLSARWGEPGGWPREPERVLAMLDGYIERTLVDDAASRKSLAVLFEHAQYLVPAGDLAALARGQASQLVRVLGWAQNPHIRRVNMAFCLIADSLGEVNSRLVESPYVATIEIPLPDREERRRFSRFVAGGDDLSRLTDFSADALSEMANGLSLASLDVVLSQAAHGGGRVDARRFRELKKSAIERQCRGLVEFIEPSHKLDLVVGHETAKQRLRDDAEAIARGQLDLAPMGYLVCGPVGTGKTFLSECYAGSIGIPCAVLKNFRSKYVGETEGNLQQVLSVLRSLGPVVVIIDEADAALGSRQAEGDSGTSARVFSMIASQMGNTRYRGQIVWMLLTSRPDLLPIDLKRQGRAEVHIPLFYPTEEAEVQAMFRVMAKKNGLALPETALPEGIVQRHFSGADIEAVVLMASRAARSAGRTELLAEDLQLALDEFIPSAQGLEKELQEIAAVLECTQMSLLPPEWQEKVSQKNGRTLLQERLVAIRQILED